MAAQVILSLSILVGLHELGHLLAAKLFGMRVEKYSIGFPPKIWGFKYGETEYSIGAIPLGGFVKISGMIDESMDTDFKNEPPKDWEYRSKPAWQRLIVMMGGIVVNIITGIVVFAVLTYQNGDRFIPKSEIDKYGIVAYELGEDHVASASDTPLRLDAFELDDKLKIELIAKHFKEIMHVLGLDLTDDSLKGTPHRVAKMYVKEAFSGLNPRNKPKPTLFENKFNYTEMIVEKDITFYSHCEHHFVPIYGKAHVAYISSGKVIGLSKINRIIPTIVFQPVWSAVWRPAGGIWRVSGRCPGSVPAIQSFPTVVLPRACHCLSVRPAPRSIAVAPHTTAPV